MESQGPPPLSIPSPLRPLAAETKRLTFMTSSSSPSLRSTTTWGPVFSPTVGELPMRFHPSLLLLFLHYACVLPLHHRWTASWLLLYLSRVITWSVISVWSVYIRNDLLNLYTVLIYLHCKLDAGCLIYPSLCNPLSCSFGMLCLY